MKHGSVLLLLLLLETCSAHKYSKYDLAMSVMSVCLDVLSRIVQNFVNNTVRKFVFCVEKWLCLCPLSMVSFIYN